ncbi:MAG: hypothetical protein RQ751_00135 [Longimicrobiales bacterium]|nr:hypothetical protein [Longimicrobiales bacterium]
MHPGAALVGVLLLAGAGALPPAVAGQGSPRLYGTVEARDGTLHRGYLRWGGEAAVWADALTGTRPVPRERVVAWRQAQDRDTLPPLRVLEVEGYRISWPEEDEDFGARRAAEVRFAHIAELRPGEDGGVEVALRWGEVVPFRAPAGLARSERVVEVEPPAGGRIVLAWADVARIVLDGEVDGEGTGPAAPDVRLHGSVQDVEGRTFTGYLGWGRAGLTTSDTLAAGRGGLPFASVSAVERREEVGGEAAEARLVGGDVRALTGRDLRDVRRRGLRVSDPTLGWVGIPWSRVRRIRFHPPAAAPAGPPPGVVPSGPLVGEVYTRAGDVYEGEVVWDADEARAWEVLDGSAGGVEMAIEFGGIASIRRREDGATVTLWDGRGWDLSGSNDVGPENRGVLVGTPTDAEGGRHWTLVPWEALAEVHFRAGGTER